MWSSPAPSAWAAFTRSCSPAAVCAWHWNLYALLGPDDRITHDGYTDTLKQAKAEFAANVRAILALARWREVESPHR